MQTLSNLRFRAVPAGNTLSLARLNVFMGVVRWEWGEYRSREAVFVGVADTGETASWLATGSCCLCEGATFADAGSCGNIRYALGGDQGRGDEGENNSGELELTMTPFDEIPFCYGNESENVSLVMLLSVFWFQGTFILYLCFQGLFPLISRPCPVQNFKLLVYYNRHAILIAAFRYNVETLK